MDADHPQEKPTDVEECEKVYLKESKSHREKNTEYYQRKTIGEVKFRCTRSFMTGLELLIVYAVPSYDLSSTPHLRRLLPFFLAFVIEEIFMSMSGVDLINSTLGRSPPYKHNVPVNI